MTKGEGMSEFCHDYGDAPDCLKVIDERFTMDFRDIGEGCLYFCAKCGERAKMMNEAINRAFQTRPGFEDDFRAAIENARSNTKIQ